MTDQRLTPAEALAALANGGKVERTPKSHEGVWARASVEPIWYGEFSEIHPDGRYLYRRKVEKVERLRCWVIYSGDNPSIVYQSYERAVDGVAVLGDPSRYRIVPMVEDVPLRVTPFLARRFANAFELIASYRKEDRDKGQQKAAELGLTVEVEG